MIHFFLIQNRQGKTRLSKWYVPSGERTKVERDVHSTITVRDGKCANFVEFGHYKLVYRRYAGLFFIAAVDANENELALFEFIHLFVELLDGYFGNVCELDLVFRFDRVYAILDELVIGGEIGEVAVTTVLGVLKSQDQLE